MPDITDDKKEAARVAYEQFLKDNPWVSPVPFEQRWDAVLKRLNVVSGGV